MRGRRKESKDDCDDEGRSQLRDGIHGDRLFQVREWPPVKCYQYRMYTQGRRVCDAGESAAEASSDRDSYQYRYVTNVAQPPARCMHDSPGECG
jgi:hypothetical protein